MSTLYSKPPIAEAVLEIQVDAAEVDRSALLAVMNGLELRYPHREDVSITTFEIDPVLGQSRAGPVQAFGFAFRSATRNRVAQIRTDRFVFSQLAPYPASGWSEWAPEARALWERYWSSVAPQRITRLGVRYINQIELPEPGEFRTEKYFRSTINLPDEMGGMVSYLLRAETMRLGEPDVRVIITAGPIVNSTGPLPKVVLDLDAVRIGGEIDPADVWNQLERLHVRIDETFEASITDETRSLFL